MGLVYYISMMLIRYSKREEKRETYAMSKAKKPSNDEAH